MKKRLLIYGIGTFFSKVIVFLMVPIYARVFSKGDFGYYDVLVSDMQMVVSVAFVEIWSGIIRFMFEEKNKYIPIKTMLRMMPILMGLYAVGVYSLSLFFEIKYPIITAIYGILYLVFSVSNSICRGLERNTVFVISGIISTFVSCSLSILFAVNMHLGIEFLLIAQCAGYFVAIIYVEIVTKAYAKAIKTDYKRGSLKDMVVYCIPLMLNSFSFLFLGTFNKNIIIGQLGEDYSGVYAYIGKFSAIVSVLLSIYALAWQEQAFVSAKSKDRELQYSHYINEFVRLIGLGIPVYVLICIIISPLFGGNQYLNSESYIPLLILSSYISNLSGVLSTVIAVKKKTSFILYSTAIGAVMNVAIASFAIKNYGINASALSLCLGFGIAAMLRFFFARKFFKLNIQWWYLVLVILETVIIQIMLIIIGSNLLVNVVLALLLFVVWFIVNLNTIKSLILAGKAILRRK